MSIIDKELYENTAENMDRIQKVKDYAVVANSDVSDHLKHMIGF